MNFSTSVWVGLARTLHHEQALARTEAWRAARHRMRHANGSRLDTAAACIAEAARRNADFGASRHLIQTAIANLEAAVPDALSDR
jgi:hypothetical protein